jgi:hypothetical protein
MKATVSILGISALHFVAGFLAFGIAFSHSMQRFDHGGGRTLSHTVSDVAVDVLWFPFLLLASIIGFEGGGVAEWILLCVNSLLWGVVIYGMLVACSHVLHAGRRRIKT